MGKKSVNFRNLLISHFTRESFGYQLEEGWSIAYLLEDIFKTMTIYSFKTFHILGPVEQLKLDDAAWVH